jgi:hypothetical protein
MCAYRKTGLAQSVQQLAANWTAEGSEFEFPVDAKLFSSPRYLDWLWDSPSLISND